MNELARQPELELELHRYTSKRKASYLIDFRGAETVKG